MAPDAIKDISVEGNAMLVERADRPTVTTGREAQLSAQHSVAVVLLYGRAGVAEFCDECVSRAEIRAMRDRVRVTESTTQMPIASARVSITLHSGEILQTLVKDARGSLQRPLTDEELEGKLRELVRHVGAKIDPSSLIDAVWSIDQMVNAGELMRLARTVADS